MIRAFLAVESSRALRAELATVQQDLKRRIEPEMKRGMRITWAQPASIHLTLKFLGDVDEGVIDPLRAALEPLIGGQRLVSVPLARLGVFPQRQRPRVLWVGPPEDWGKGAEAVRMAGIHGAIEEACEGLGLIRENKFFSPHLTLGRIKVGERQVGVALARSGALDHPLSPASLAVGSVALIQSELKATGPVHTKLWEVRLLGPSGEP